MKSIAVIGQGFVGGSLTTVFAERGFDVCVYDKTGKVATGGRAVLAPALEPDEETHIQKFVRACEEQSSFSCVYFVCVPTPMFENGDADLSIVEQVLQELSSVPGERVAVVKSTVPPGSTERWNRAFEATGLRVIFNPEFLTEANALDDMRNQNRIILGGPRPWINKAKLIFQTAFPKVPLIKTSSTTAEMVKYTINCFLATKVSFANEMAQICEALDAKGLNIDYDKVIEYAKLDPRLGDSHWAVPGPVPTHDGRYVRGFGGHCFPKDMNALAFIAASLGIDSKVISAALAKNLELRPPVDRDWERMEGRAVSKKSLKSTVPSDMKTSCSATAAEHVEIVDVSPTHVSMKFKVAVGKKLRTPKNLREELGVTKEQLIASMKKVNAFHATAIIERVEKLNDDVSVLDLQRYVEALGGKLEISLKFPNGDHHIVYR